MRTRSAVLAAVGLGAAVVVGGAGWAAARDDGAPATGWRRDFVCAHLSELQQDQATRLQLVNSTVTLAGFTPANRPLLTESATFAPAGAGPVSATVPLTDRPPLTEFGESVTERTPTGKVTLATLDGAESPPPL